MNRNRAIVNTYLSITGSVISAISVCRFWLRKLDMEVVLNATLSGGVVMGACCDLITGPGFAMLTGMIAGFLAAFGFLFVNKFL